ncbi:MAG: DUF3185 family protein [Elusimicrobia bacterium]|nr:DUF3185 family protein [Elusimicrobiota bacterium]
MNRAGIGVLLATGLVLLAHGVDASKLFAPGARDLFVGSPGDRTFWLTIGGLFSFIGGSVGALGRVKA